MEGNGRGKHKQAEICVGWAWDMFNEFFATHTSIPPRLSIILKEKQKSMNLGQDVEWERCNEVNSPKEKWPGEDMILWQGYDRSHYSKSVALGLCGLR